MAMQKGNARRRRKKVKEERKFLFKLIQVTGFHTVTELEYCMSLRELYEWYEYYSEQPFFADRIEMQLATICLQISGFGKSKAKHEDFMICKKSKPILSQEEKNKQLISAFKSI